MVLHTRIHFSISPITRTLPLLPYPCSGLAIHLQSSQSFLSHLGPSRMFFLLSVQLILSCQPGIHTQGDEVSLFVSPSLLSSQHPSLPITPDPEGDCGRREGKKAQGRP